MSAVWRAFYEYLVGLGLNERTVVYYVRHARNAEVFLHVLGVSLQTCRPSQLAEWAKRLPNSHSSRGQAAAALGHYWEWVGRRNPPAKAIRIPPRPEMVCKTLNEREVRDLIKVSLGWWPQGATVLIGLYLALRRFEIAKAEWGRFDPQMEWYRVTGKRDKTATLPVHDILRSELEPHRGAGWLFPGRFNGPINSATCWTWIDMVSKEANVRYMTPHRLRHTALTWAVDSGKQLRDVQVFARHSDPAMTARYTRTTQTRLREVVDALDYLGD